MKKSFIPSESDIAEFHENMAHSRELMLNLIAELNALQRKFHKSPKEEHLHEIFWIMGHLRVTAHLDDDPEPVIDFTPSRS